MRSVELRYYPICWQDGERPWWTPARAVDVYCDVCGRALDTFQPRLVRTAQGQPTMPSGRAA